MGIRRGLTASERVSADFVNVTSTGTVLPFPCYVYRIALTLSDSTTSGKLSIGDSTASADLVKESTRLDLKVGTAGASGNANPQTVLELHPPLNIANQLFFNNSTGIASVSVTYISA
jgi:hypothetical protein